mgnify:FL=1
MNMRVKAYVCLLSFALGLFSASAAPVVAQQSVSMPSPEARASSSNMWQNPYYRAMNTPYYNPNLAYNNNRYTPGNNTQYGTGGYGAYGNSGMTPMGNRSQTSSYYNGMMDPNVQANPQNRRYTRSYGNRYQPGYYGYGNSSSGFQLPGIIGAVAGLALGASCFGWMGALIGGIGGYFLGDVVGKWLLPSGMGYNNPYGNPYGQQYGRSSVPLISGLIGAGVGAFMLSSFGMFGMVLGGAAGFMLARLAVRLISPELYYYGFQRPGAYPQQGNNYYYSPQTTPQEEIQQVSPSSSTTTKASETGDGKLSTLQEDFYQAMRDYKKALVEGDEASKMEMRKNYLEKREAYEAAKEQASAE